jgi:hypothetical protein
MSVAGCGESSQILILVTQLLSSKTESDQISDCPCFVDAAPHDFIRHVSMVVLSPVVWELGSVALG